MRFQVQNNCIYCGFPNNLDDFALKIGDLEYSVIYLHLDCTYKGRCIVTLKEHRTELFDLDGQKLSKYMAEVMLVARIIKKVFGADKMNYAIYGDKVSHVHFHLVPKLKDGPDWGESFQLVPERFETMGWDEIEECQTKILNELKDACNVK